MPREGTVAEIHLAECGEQLAEFFSEKWSCSAGIGVLPAKFVTDSPRINKQKTGSYTSSLREPPKVRSKAEEGELQPLTSVRPAARD